MSDDFSYEDFSSVEEGIERYKRKQNIRIYGRRARVFSRYARYFFIGIIVFGIFAILLAYAWHLMKKERIVIETVQSENISNDSFEKIKVIDDKGNEEIVSMISKVTHFKIVNDKKIGNRKYDILTRWEYKNASNAKIGANPASQSCYANYNENSLSIRVELFSYKDGRIINNYTNSELLNHSLSVSDVNSLKKYCRWKN